MMAFAGNLAVCKWSKSWHWPISAAHDILFFCSSYAHIFKGQGPLINTAVRQLRRIRNVAGHALSSLGCLENGCSSSGINNLRCGGCFLASRTAGRPLSNEGTEAKNPEARRVESPRCYHFVAGMSWRWLPCQLHVGKSLLGRGGRPSRYARLQLRDGVSW